MLVELKLLKATGVPTLYLPTSVRPATETELEEAESGHPATTSRPSSQKSTRAIPLLRPVNSRHTEQLPRADWTAPPIPLDKARHSRPRSEAELHARRDELATHLGPDREQLVHAVDRADAEAREEDEPVAERRTGDMPRQAA